MSRLPLDNAEFDRLNLHLHQQTCVNATLSAWAQGWSRVLGLAPTGAGKTIIFLEILNKYIQEGNHTDRALMVAHTRRIVDQIAGRVTQFYPDLWPLGIINGDGKTYHHRHTAATIQSMKPHTLEQLVAYGDITLLVQDEAHRAVGNSFMEMSGWLQSRYPDLHTLGVTATPERGDGRPLDKAFDYVAFRIDVRHLLDWGFLATPITVPVQLPVNLDGVPRMMSRYGEDVGYDMFYVGQRYDIDDVNRLIRYEWEKNARDRRTIFFVPTVSHAVHLTAEFKHAGHDAHCVYHGTPQSERNVIEQDAHIIVNVFVYGEGADLPNIGCVGMVAPTSVQARYIQMVGRGLRPDTKDCIILDFYPEHAHDLVMGRDVFKDDPGLITPVDQRLLHMNNKYRHPRFKRTRRIVQKIARQAKGWNGEWFTMLMSKLEDF